MHSSVTMSGALTYCPLDTWTKRWVWQRLQWVLEACLTFKGAEKLSSVIAGYRDYELFRVQLSAVMYRNIQHHK